MLHSKVLTLPTEGGGTETFDMRKIKLVVRVERNELSSIFLIDECRLVYTAHNRGASQPYFNSALVLVGKFLADNPNF